MVVSSLTSSKYWDLGENQWNWTHLWPNSKLSMKQNELIDVFTIAQLTSNRHIQAVISNLKFIILDYLAPKTSIIMDWRRDFCDWSINSPIWKVMPSRHLTKYKTLRDNALHMHAQSNRFIAFRLGRFPKLKNNQGVTNWWANHTRHYHCHAKLQESCPALQLMSSYLAAKCNKKEPVWISTPFDALHRLASMNIAKQQREQTYQPAQRSIARPPRQSAEIVRYIE